MIKKELRMVITEENKTLETTTACKPEFLQADKMNCVLNTISESMILFSSDMRVELANKAACKFFNLSSDHVIGKHCTELYGSETSPCGNDYRKCPIIENSEPKDQHTSEYESADGNRWLRTCYPITDHEGRMINIVQTFQNITKQIKAEKEKEIIKSKLIQSQKMEAIGKLAGGISHDFNNIMSVVVGFADLIRIEGKVDNMTLNYVDEIQKAGRRAASITNQLLAFNRKQILKPELVDLNDLVMDTERMLRVLLHENTKLSSNLSQGLSKVEVDPGQIIQVIMNLVINAKDSMLDGGLITIETENKYLDEVSCEFHPEMIPGDYILLAVSDTGCGIAPEILVKVFEPFFTTKGVGKGTGLGLSTVYGIIKQSGGYVYIYSELNYGTTFKIYLPKAMKADCRGKDVTMTRMVLSGNERILLVEDDKSLSKVISKILCELGYIVYQSDSGEEARWMYSKYKVTGIDLLVSDIVMPGMDERELAETLLKVNPKMKILYISGYTNDIIAHHRILDDDVSFLAKPFSICEIATKVRSILDK